MNREIRSDIYDENNKQSKEQLESLLPLPLIHLPYSFNHLLNRPKPPPMEVSLYYTKIPNHIAIARARQSSRFSTAVNSSTFSPFTLKTIQIA